MGQCVWFYQAFGFESEWQIRMHGAFSISCEEKDQSCHHEVKMHLSRANPQGHRAAQYKHVRQLLLKERTSP